MIITRDDYMLAAAMRSGTADDLLGIIKRAFEIVVAFRGEEAVEKLNDPLKRSEIAKRRRRRKNISRVSCCEVYRGAPVGNKPCRSLLLIAG